MRRRAALGALVATTMVLSGCLGQPQNADTARNADATEISLTITGNAVAGGKNAAKAAWVTDWVIPRFVEQQKQKGVTATVRFDGNGAGDEDYKTKIALDLKTGGGADIMGIDGIWVGEFAGGSQIKPLEEIVGKDKVEAWEGWKQIPQAVQSVGSFEGKRYGVPDGTDGRVLFYNKKLFARAGLPADWQPRSWDELLSAGEALKRLPGVTPIQLNAGTAMGEAATMQGVLPMLVGTGKPLLTDGKWQGATSNVKDVLGLYQRIYGSGLGDPLLQQEAKGRDKSFAQFADNKIGILLESDYLWRSVLEPTKGAAKMADRNSSVGWALVPAQRPGSGVRGQDFVSMSGGSINLINANSKYPAQAWELLQLMNSAEAVKARLGGAAQVTQRTDVNNEVLAGDPMLSFVAQKVLPITEYRPGVADYTRVSAALQQATADVVSGKTAQEALTAYQAALTKVVGEAKVVSG
ncbi:extracellular solute-binding protein [Allokutzneria oryzae]|uniref:Extracellular solute-binding protein n=1 Tax=Allokutzneria oryzae TaxID=1378989 RepID=A0ABV6A569_9PSEU